MRKDNKIAKIYELSPMQKGMLFHSYMQESTAEYFEQMLLQIQGELNIELLTESFQKLVQRYDVFRTAFVSDKLREPRQIVLNERPIPVYHESILHVSEEERDSYIAAYREKDRGKGFDLIKDPLLRVAILSGSDIHYIIWSFHHIIMDGWCMQSVINDLLEYYKSLLLHQEPALKDVRPFSEYIKWLLKQNREEAGKYWSGYLNDYHGATGVSAGEFTERKEYKLKEVRFTLDASSIQSIKKIADKNYVTLSTFMHCIWGVLLGHYNNSQDVLFGSVVSGRPPEIDGVDQMVGLFINNIPIRIIMHDTMTFAGLLRKVQKDMLNSEKYNYLSLSDIQEAAKSNRRLINHILIFENYPMSEEIIIYEINGQTKIGITFSDSFEQTNYDFNLVILPGDSFEIRMKYNASVYEESYIKRIEGHLKTIIAMVTDNPQVLLSKLEIVTPEEKEILLNTFNQTEDSFDGTQTLCSLFSKQAEKAPDRIAVAAGSGRLTYRELDERSTYLAMKLRAAGVRRNHAVGLMMDRSVEMIVGILGILRAGGAYLPISLSCPPQRMNDMLLESGAAVLVTKSAFIEGTGICDVETVLLDREYSFQTAKCKSKDFTIDNDVSPDSLSYVIYTSGSSGWPKGVMIEHQNVVNLVNSLYQKVYKQYQGILNIALVSPYIFDASVKQIFPSLLLGHCLCMTTEESRLDGTNLLRFYQEYQIDISDGTPTHMKILLDAMKNNILDKLPVRQFLLGGEPLTVSLVQEMYKKMSSSNPIITNVYGPTECCDVSTLSQTAETDTFITIGAPISNVKGYILGRHLELKPIGIPGELCLSGAGLGRGYINQEELTQKVFVEHPFIPGERIYRTGDMAKWDERGHLILAGRIDNQVKVRGYRIEIEEIEHRMTKLSQIKEAAVTVIRDPEGDYLCAYIVEAGPLNIDEVIQELSIVLPDYMIPSRFIKLEELPISTNGKVDRRALPEPGLYGRKEIRKPLIGEVQEQLGTLFRDILKIDTINRTDNFFHMGGHSLRAMSLVSAIQKEFTIEISLPQVFKTPTVESLAEYIKKAEKGSYHPILPQKERNSYPLNYVQKKLYAIARIHEADIAYHIPVLYLVEGNMDIKRINHAFTRMIRRHDALRTVFVMEQGEVVQKVQDQAEFQIDRITTNDSGPKALIKTLIRPFDMTQAPLVRAAFITAGEGQSYLFFDIHHIIADGISMKIFMEELIRFYEGKDMKPQQLQYKDYVLWEESPARIAARKKQSLYWEGVYQESYPILSMTADYPRPAIQSYEGGRISFTIDNELYQRLTSFCRETDVTLHALLLAQYYVLLYKYTEQEDIVVGLPMAGRNHPDLDRVFGIFIHVAGIRNYPQADKSFIQFLQEVKESVLYAYENQYFNAEELMRKENIKRDLSRNPFYDTVFTLDSAHTIQIDFDEIKMTAQQYDLPYSKFDLSVTGIEAAGEILFEMEYAAKIYRKETMEQLARHFIHIIAETLAKPNGTLGETELLLKEEKEYLYKHVISGCREHISDKNIIELIMEQVNREPDHIAVVYDGTSLTYRELDQKSEDAARAIVALGNCRDVKRDTIVALLLENSADLIVGMLAAMKAGAVFLPIDPEYPQARIEWVIEDSDALCVMTNRATAAKLAGRKTIESTRKLLFMEELKQVPRNNQVNPVTLPIKREGADCAYVLYTSGSTGQPKGVMVSNRSLMNFCEWYNEYYQVTSEDRTTKYAGVSFDISLSEVFPHLIKGASIHIIHGELRYDLERLNDYYEENQITIAFLPAQICEQFMKLENHSLRFLLSGAEELKRFIPRTYQLVNNYGPTETTIFSSVYQLSEEVSSIPIGRPIRNTQIYILNTALQLQPIGVSGEIYIGGEGLAIGYLNREDLTKERFITSPFDPEQLLYRTGDLGRWNHNGEVEYFGRRDNQVKIRGYRIELGEIERAILQAGNVIETAAVIRTINNTAHIVAYIVADKDFSVKSLENQLSAMLPVYMLPAYYRQLEALPLNRSGKVDRNALPLPDISAVDNYQAPQNEKERLLVTVWEEVLGLQRVGTQDNYFEIGGNSILMMDIIARLGQYQWKVGAKYFMEHPCIVELAQAMTSTQQGNEEAVPMNQALPLLPNRSILDIRNRGNHVDHWNICVLLEVDRIPDKQRFHEVLTHLLAHHDGLRLQLIREENGWKQFIKNKDMELPVTYIDFSELSDQIKKEEIEKKIRQFQETSNMASNPIHFAVFDLGANQPGRIMIIVHHGLIDAYAVSVLLQDIETLLLQADQGVEMHLPHKTTSIIEWTNCLYEYANSDEIKKDIEYWTDIPEQPGSLPVDNQQNINQNFFMYENIETVDLLSQTDSDYLFQSVLGSDIQINDILMTALIRALHRWTGQSGFLIDFTVNGRYPLTDHIDLSRTIAWLAHLVPIYFKVTGSDNRLTDFNQVREKLKQLPKGGLSYGCLRYLCEDQKIRERMDTIRHPEITYSFFMRSQAASKDNGILNRKLRIAQESTGENEGAYIYRGRLIDFVAGIREGRLYYRFHYSKNIHETATIRELSGFVQEEFRQLFTMLHFSTFQH